MFFVSWFCFSKLIFSAIYFRTLLMFVLVFGTFFTQCDDDVEMMTFFIKLTLVQFDLSLCSSGDRCSYVCHDCQSQTHNQYIAHLHSNQPYKCMSFFVSFCRLSNLISFYSVTFEAVLCTPCSMFCSLPLPLFSSFGISKWVRLCMYL